MAIHPKIFLSHSHRDRHFATELQAVLETQGAETYLDQDKIQAGDILPKRIREGIAWCDMFLLIWSSRAAVSAWVGKEWDTAYELRKIIIPYSLDNTPLPAALQNLVRVEADDRQHGDANLLKAVFGRDFTPAPTTLFPGNWYASVDAFGMVKGNYDLELRANGQVEGKGGIEQSGVAGDLARSLGVEGMLSMRIPVQGNWSYDRGSQMLTLTVTASGFGQQNTDVVRIRTTGRERGEIQGQDLAGRTWTLRRVEKRNERQELRDTLQNLVDTSINSPIFCTMFAAMCHVIQASGYDLGLSTEQIKKVGQLDVDACNDVLRQLQQRGWLK